MYVCMYVCMYMYMNIYAYNKCNRIDYVVVYMYSTSYGSMYICINECMYVCSCNSSFQMLL